MRKLKLREVMAQGSWCLFHWTGRPRKEAVGKRTGLGRWAYWSRHLCLQKTENWIPIYLKQQQPPEILLKQVTERLKAGAEYGDWNYYGSDSFHLSRLLSSTSASFSGCLSYCESRKLPASNKKTLLSPTASWRMQTLTCLGSHVQPWTNHCSQGMKCSYWPGLGHVLPFGVWCEIGWSQRHLRNRSMSGRVEVKGKQLLLQEGQRMEAEQWKSWASTLVSSREKKWAKSSS